MLESMSNRQLVDQLSQYKRRDHTIVDGFKRSKHVIGEGYRNFLAHWDIPHGGTFLDLGTGMGEAADFLRESFGAFVAQSDISIYPLLLQQTWLRRVTHQTKPLIVAKAIEQGFLDNTFDAVHVKDVFVHIEDKQKFFSEMSRVLKPGGKLLIVTQTIHHSCVFLRSPANTHGKAPAPKMVHIDDGDHYALLARLIVNFDMTYEGEAVAAISPPYFTTMLGKLPHVAAAYGLTKINDSYIAKNGWTPAKNEPDWHHENRTVLEFVKN